MQADEDSLRLPDRRFSRVYQVYRSDAHPIRSQRLEKRLTWYGVGQERRRERQQLRTPARNSDRRESGFFALCMALLAPVAIGGLAYALTSRLIPNLGAAFVAKGLKGVDQLKGYEAGKGVALSACALSA